ncbi:MAG: EAL domain-containing protein [Pseudomonadota bacterium]
MTNDELVLWYQPKIDMRNGQIVGAESLARWTHPTLGQVFP